MIIPFLLIQGSEEFTQETAGGTAVMDDEQKALRDFFALNGVFDKGEAPDYGKTPYWGYKPDETVTDSPDYTDYGPQGMNPVHRSNVKWEISRYYTDGYVNPLVELILVEGF